MQARFPRTSEGRRTRIAGRAASWPGVNEGVLATDSDALTDEIALTHRASQISGGLSARCARSRAVREQKRPRAARLGRDRPEKGRCGGPAVPAGALTGLLSGTRSKRNALACGLHANQKSGVGSQYRSDKAREEHRQVAQSQERPVYTRRRRSILMPRRGSESWSG